MGKFFTRTVCLSAVLLSAQTAFLSAEMEKKTRFEVFGGGFVGIGTTHNKISHGGIGTPPNDLGSLAVNLSRSSFEGGLDVGLGGAAWGFVGFIFGEIGWIPTDPQGTFDTGTSLHKVSIESDCPLFGAGVQLGYRCNDFTPYVRLAARWRYFKVNLHETIDGTPAREVAAKASDTLVGFSPGVGLMWRAGKCWEIGLEGSWDFYDREHVKKVALGGASVSVPKGVGILARGTQVLVRGRFVFGS